jgi:hypothetical protein
MGHGDHLHGQAWVSVGWSGDIRPSRLPDFLALKEIKGPFEARTPSEHFGNPGTADWTNQKTLVVSAIAIF